MKTLEITGVKGPVESYARRRHAEPMILTVNGKPVAAVTPISAFDIECAHLSNNARLSDIIEKSWQEYLGHGGYSTDEMRTRLRLPPKKPAKPARRRKSR